MPTQLRSAMQEFLEDWTSDLSQNWQAALGGVTLGFDAIAPELMLDIWEPIFPVRRGHVFPGMPEGTHMLRAFDGPEPTAVRCIILGQDPYPEPGFATGRAFEAGNVAEWHELNKMFSKSIRAYLQMLLAARTGNQTYAGSFADWPIALEAIEQGTACFEEPDKLADHLEAQGVLLLNAALTLTRFSVDPGQHQTHGHLPLWRPLIEAVLDILIARDAPLVIIAFGDAATHILANRGISEGYYDNLAVILRPHPAYADAVLARPNPFLLCNDYLEAMGAAPIDW